MKKDGNFMNEKEYKEYNERELDKVIAGTTYEIGQNQALKYPQMYRVVSVEQINKQFDLHEDRPEPVFDTKQITEEELNYLKEHTHLGPIAALKLANAKSINLQLATELEYELRTSAWERICEKAWKRYGDGQSLSEFAYDTLSQQLTNNYGGPRR